MPPWLRRCDGLFRAIGRLHAERALTLEQDIAADHVARCAPEDLDEMLGNLLDNACKWGRSRVRVSSSLHDGRLIVTVDDDGEGVDPTLLPRVVQRGVRADERVPGSGLGLAIVHDLVELYEGSLALDRSAPRRAARAAHAPGSSVREPCPAAGVYNPRDSSVL